MAYVCTATRKTATTRRRPRNWPRESRRRVPRSGTDCLSWIVGFGEARLRCGVASLLGPGSTPRRKKRPLFPAKYLSACGVWGQVRPWTPVPPPRSGLGKAWFGLSAFQKTTGDESCFDRDTEQTEQLVYWLGRLR